MKLARISPGSYCEEGSYESTRSTGQEAAPGRGPGRPARASLEPADGADLRPLDPLLHLLSQEATSDRDGRAGDQRFPDAPCDSAAGQRLDPDSGAVRDPLSLQERVGPGDR